MFEENEDLVENTENVESETTEEITEQEVTEEVPEKKYTEEEFNSRLDELLAKKISRIERKTQKKYEDKYGELESILKAGTGEEDLDKIKDSFKSFYQSKGIETPSQYYNDYDLERLGINDAEDIIEDGYDSIVKEVDRLAEKSNNMSIRERATFMKLAKERTILEEEKELASIGIGREELENTEFKEYNSKLNPNLPLKERYEMYLNTKEKEKIEKMGSMKSGNVSKVKDYYTQAEIEKLTEEDLDNPEIWEAVRKSMTNS